jgi:predicted AlkP superfamily pyrophosphatase or phosphodiesterase
VAGVKFGLLLVLLGWTIGCSGTATAPVHPAAQPEGGTRLVVLVVIDQWPEWSFEAKRAAFHAGFQRALAEGEWHVGEHPSAATLTAVGHALLGTGAAPAQSGILANEWWHRDLHEVLTAVEGEDHHETTSWLRVRGLGDVLAPTKGKAVAVSLKSRAALLPLGHTGLAVWYDAHAGRFHAYDLVKSTPSQSPRPWLEAYTTAHPLAARLEPWTPLPDTAQLAGVPDDNRGEFGDKGFGPTFPHDPSATKNPLDTVFTTPLGDDVVLEIATEAIRGEQLGADATPDLLVISLSAHDFVGHGWGHESIEQWDLERRLDDSLAQFMDTLDRQVGASHWAMVLTSDHGASPLPESLGGGRITHDQIRAAANAAASASLGPGDWIANAHYPNIYFTDAFFHQPPSEQKSALKRVLNALRSFPALEQVGITADIAGHCDARPPADRPLCETFDPQRSGDLYYLPARGWIMDTEDEPAATAHGSLHDYDRDVPLIILPPDRTPHEPQAAPSNTVPMETVAPLLARWLGTKL